MVSNNVFEPVYDIHGDFGLQSKDCKTGLAKVSKPEHKMVLTAWRSPHATADQNAWLEANLQKIYTKYYLKVLIETLGRFW